MKARVERLLAILTVGGPETITVLQVAMIVDIATRIFGKETIDKAIEQQRTKSKAHEEGMCIVCIEQLAAEKEELCIDCLNLLKKDLAQVEEKRFAEKSPKKIVH